MRALAITSVFAVLFLGLSMPAAADVVLSPISVTTSIPSETTYPLCTPGKMIDQSGLTVNFISGVTDYATYMTQSPKHNSLQQDGCYLSENDLFNLNGVMIDMDLGKMYDISHILIWNGTVNQANAETGIKNTKIWFSSFANFSASTIVNVVPPAVSDPLLPFAPFVYDLASPQSARYVRIHGIDNYGNPEHYSVSEVVFGVVPEPTTLGLLALGALGVLRRRRA